MRSGLRLLPRINTTQVHRPLQSAFTTPIPINTLRVHTAYQREYRWDDDVFVRMLYKATAGIFATSLAVTSMTVSSPALADSFPRDIPTDAKSGTHDWKGVLHRLNAEQKAHPSASKIHAIRHALPSSPKAAVSALAGAPSDVCTHSVEFPLSRSADAHGVLATLTAGLAGSSDANVRIDDTSTRRRTIISRPHEFEVSVIVPRVPSFDGRVAIDLFKSAENAKFSDAELEAIVNAYRISQDTTDAVRLLDGKNSVDIGPPTRIERRKPGAHERRYSFSGSAPPPPKSSRPAIPPSIFDDDEDDEDDEDGNQHRNDAEQTRKLALEKLKEHGVEVFEKHDNLTWDALAGYSAVKQRIEETLTLPLRHPDIYNRIVQGTRARVEPNVPKAVLYEGPPGCGKTLSARILASSIGVPFVHIRIETLLSKYYGETTRKLAEVLESANALGKCIVFLDECDSVGLRRSGGGGNDVHEVTRRTLSVLLRFIDGMDGAKDAIILAATNHKEDLDAALISRFDVVVSFPLPDFDTRVAVLKLYAKQLSEEHIREIAELTWGFSGRELLDVCEEAERMRAGVIVRSREHDLKSNANVPGSDKSNEPPAEDQLPQLHEYVEAVNRKADHVIGRWNLKFRGQRGSHSFQNNTHTRRAVTAES